MNDRFLPGFEKTHRACRNCQFEPGGYARCSRSKARLDDIDRPCSFIEEAEDGEAEAQQTSESE